MISAKILPYQNHPEAWIISCYFNPGKYSSRRRNFEIFYEQLHGSKVNYLIAECAFGIEEFELPKDDRILQFRAKHQLWQKERLLNLLIKQLPLTCKYVFWLDADVLLNNPNWIPEAVENLQTNTICQPFSLAVRLEKDDMAPNFNVQASKVLVDYPSPNSPPQTRLWRSFAYNYCKNRHLAESSWFDIHGHTGFAWGARREILEQVPLFDKAIVGTADHIIAHAAVGQIPHPCLEKAFTDPRMLDRVYQWSRQFNQLTHNQIGFVEGELWHLWHGDLKNRQYLQRTQDFSEIDFDLDEDLIVNDDELYEFSDDRQDVQGWMNNYFESRQEDYSPPPIPEITHQPHNIDFYPPDSTLDASLDATTETASTSESGGGFDGGGAGGGWENYS
jgi:hypothetical protein